MRFEALVLLAAAATASAQAVVGKAYGFAAGTTGGGSAAAVTPSTIAELTKYLADDTPRVILINKTFDFTGTKSSGKGCDRKSCKYSNGGQYYLGDLSCGSSDNVVVNAISYDVAGNAPLSVGSNKSILGVGGKGVLKGKGLSLKKGASNIIIQGVEFTTINPVGSAHLKANKTLLTDQSMSFGEVMPSTSRAPTTVSGLTTASSL